MTAIPRTELGDLMRRHQARREWSASAPALCRNWLSYLGVSYTRHTTLRTLLPALDAGQYVDPDQVFKTSHAKAVQAAGRNIEALQRLHRSMESGFLSGDWTYQPTIHAAVLKALHAEQLILVWSRRRSQELAGVVPKPPMAAE